MIRRLKARFTNAPVFCDERLWLYMSADEEDIDDLHIQQGFLYRMSPPNENVNAGRISLRVGESRELYYFGHIGYHVNKPYRGAYYAATACELILPLCKRLGIRSLCITTDIDNIASQKTCLRLGCLPELTVDVPLDLQRRFGLPAQKKRYILYI